MVGLIDWGTVLSKNPDKRKYLLQILPIENFNIKVLSCMILKELPRHGETDLLAQVQIDAYSPEVVANLISSFEEKSFTTLNVKKADQIFQNGKKTVFAGTRICQHNVQSKGKSPPRREDKDTNCPSECSFKLKPCKKVENCRCLSFSITNRHNHVVDGGDSLKWHKISEKTRDAFIAFHKQKMSVPKAQIEYEKVMIAEHGEEAWNRWSADRSICPDNKWAYNLWQRLNLVSRGSLNGPDAFIKAVESVKA